MTQQPFYHNGSYYYGDNFQPLDTNFDNNFRAWAEHSWLNSNQEIADPFSSLYEGAALPIEQTNVDLTQLHATSQHDSAYNSISPYTPAYDFPVAAEEAQFLPQYPPYPPCPQQQLQTIEYNAELQTSSILILPSKRPEVSAKPLLWKEIETFVQGEEVAKTTKKRKTRSIAPTPPERDGGSCRTSKKSSKTQATSNRSLEDCMGLFDTTLTATKEKRRRKIFSVQEKKAVKSVRNVGACIQCKFRKKTCSAGRPCPYCARIGGSSALGAQLCHRESPFLDRTMSHYYPNTSRRRLVDFRLSDVNVKGCQRDLYIDGAGPATFPLRIKILECDIAELRAEDVASIYHTAKHADPKSLSKDIQILDLAALVPGDLEKWVVEYTAHFTKTKLPRATGFLFGLEYVARGLPHSDLVMKITRLVSLNFVLRAGVTILPSSPAFIDSPFRTIQAQIDTLLFQSFQATEKCLYQDLQRLIFRSAGSLARDAVVPVCFCVWQLARLQCMLASHLSNLATYNHNQSLRASPTPPDASPFDAQNLPSSSAALPSPKPENSPSSTMPDPNTEFRHRKSEAENLEHGLNLLLCTFEALFRTACPLLLDWDDDFSKELLGHNAYLVQMATRMGRTLRAYRNDGHSRRFKLGFGYRKEMADRIRGLLREK